MNRDDDSTAPGPLSSVDLVLLRAARAFGGRDDPGFWHYLPAERRASLRWGWESGQAGDAEAAHRRLAEEHEAQARPDLARVHSSWWVRAIQNEPESVRRAVAAHLPEGIAGPLREGLQLDGDQEPEAAALRPDRPSHPVALQAALALWTVRLVGDVIERDDDPPVIVALTRLDPYELTRLIRSTGLAKYSLAAHPVPGLTAGDEERLASYREAFAEADPRLVQVATRDVEAIGSGTTHAVAYAGMFTFARLLNAAEPYRARWALQHVPYATARTLRSLMGPAARKAPMLARWETGVLQVAWSRLFREGRVSLTWERAR